VGTGTLEWSEELFRLFGLDPGADEPSFEVWRLTAAIGAG
jgi:hypothetical protein